MCSEDLVELFLVCDIASIKFRTFSTNQFNAIDDFGRGVVEIVDNNDFVAGFEECKGGERTNVASSAVMILALKDS